MQFNNLILERGARFYNSKFGKLCLFSFSILFVLLFLNSSFALTLSCGFSTTCSYPSYPVIYVQNDTGGFENAHAQNTSAVSLEGLLGWWRFDNMSAVGENDTRVFDWSGMNNNGTVVNGAFQNSSGRLNGAYNFDGVNDHISVPYSSVLAPTTRNFSVSLWFNSARINQNNQNIFSKTQTGGYQLSINENSACTNNQLCFLLYNGTRYHQATIAASTLSSNTWYHMVGTYNGTGMSLYLNGTLVAVNTTISGPITYSSSNTLCIGAEPGVATCSDGSYFNGSIDEVMIFNRSLSAAEVQALYNKNYYTYNNALCCTSDTNLSYSCTQSSTSTPLRLYNYTNSHVQLGSQSTYTAPVCFSSAEGRVQCEYTTSSCSIGYVCIGSIASSEIADANLTNSHIGSCNTYTQKICCRVNTPPAVQNVVLNSTFKTNTTNENLTVYFNQSDLDGDYVTNITDWRIDGQSIAILNMPFDTEFNSTTSGGVRDYSTYGNNGTLLNGTSWTSSGKFGGGYRFDGVDDYLEISNSAALNPSQITINLWAKSNNVTWDKNGCLLSKRPVYVLHPDMNGKAVRAIAINASGTQFASYGPAPADITIWHMYSMTFNGSVVTGYIDGVGGTPATVNGGIYTGDTGPVLIGVDDTYVGSRHCNLTIDQVVVFNRSLSSSQIYELYLAGVNNRSLQKIVAEETEKGQNWTCLVTPNDRMDGTGVLSNQIIINNTAPTVTLLTPTDNNVTTNRTPYFSWDGNDVDGDSLTYEINITAMSIGGTSLCSDLIYVSAGSNEYYSPTRDLHCLSDNKMVYNWSVRANDGTQWGAWASYRLLNVSSYLAVSLPTNSVEFGSITILQSNDTTDDAPLPFRLQNDGNSKVNVSVSSTALWNSTSMPSRYYQYKIGNVTGEEGAFDWASSVTSFVNFSATDIQSIFGLNYSDSKDIARVDVRVEVPSNEPPAVRNTTVTFMALLGEY